MLMIRMVQRLFVRLEVTCVFSNIKKLNNVFLAEKPEYCILKHVATSEKNVSFYFNFKNNLNQRLERLSYTFLMVISNRIKNLNQRLERLTYAFLMVISNRIK